MNKSIYLLLCLNFFAGCTVSPYRDSSPNDTAFKQEPKIQLAESDQIIVVISKQGDSLQSLATQYLGDLNKAWIIADANGIDKVVPGIEIIIPRQYRNKVGISETGIQSVPILCYHRFGDKHGKMSVSTKKFRRQMQYLKDNNYRVISLREAAEFLRGNKQIPQRSVVITIDDGYRSNYTEAFPIFQEFQFPATIFLYSDFLGAPDALTSKQIQTMYDSGLIEFQPHSKTHPNMAIRKPGENRQQYMQKIDSEIDVPSKRITNIIDTDIFSFAYPFGDTNDIVINKLKRRDFTVAATVQPGNNTAYSTPYMLRRTMIFGDHSDEEFIAALTIFEKHNLELQ